MSDSNANQKETMSNKTYWADHMKQWEGSGLSQPAYCEQAGIKHSSFVYWRGLLASQSGSTTNKKFIALHVTKNSLTASEGPKSIQIKLLNGHVVHIPLSIAIKEIGELLCAIGASHA
jgi:hypothetical protein